MTPYADAWQESWDRQQEAYLPDREERFAALLTAVDAVTGGAPPRVLDLAGGTGTISLRTLARFPAAEVTLLDVDPVLLTIARRSLGDARVVAADLSTPAWSEGLGGFDAVLTATALHWLHEQRLAELYAEIRGVLRPGGVFVNADHMPDDGLPGLTKALVDRADQRREARYATGAAVSWRDWWDRYVAADPELAAAAAHRSDAGHHSDFAPPVSWHLDALRAAGYSETGMLWRGGADAAVAAVV